jgi:type I restriction enzyme S subunit
MAELNKLPNLWKWVKLQDIAKWGSGGTPTSTNSSFYGGNIPWLIIGDLNDGSINVSKKNITKLGLDNSSAKLVQPESVLIAMYGSIGKLGINKIPLATNQAIAFTEVLNENVINKYLFYYLFHIRSKLHSLGKGGTQKNISQSVLKQVDFPLPPFSEQQAIVSKIEELLSELENGKQQLQIAQQQLKVYRQSMLKWAFEGKLTNKNVKEGELPEGWKKVKIGDICKCIVPNRDKPKSFSGNIKWVTTPNLKADSIRLNYENISLGLNEEEIKEYNARVIPIGGVIMTCVGTFGLSAVVEKPVVINQQLHAFISNEVIEAKFLAYCIQNSKDYFEKKSTSTTIQYLNKGNCNSMIVNLCSIQEQQLIVSELESKLTVCDKIEETISQSLLQAETLRQSILKKAFEGRLI